MDILFYVNVGESEYRSWEDCRRYGFLAAGGAQRRIKQISSLQPNDLVAAYLRGGGYVGIGKVLEIAVPVDEFRVGDRPLSELQLEQPGILLRSGHHDVCDHLVKVNWLITVDRSLAKWERGLFASQLIKASLSNQLPTISFLEREFRVRFKELI